MRAAHTERHFCFLCIIDRTAGAGYDEGEREVLRMLAYFELDVPVALR
ncbi:hypothetical protein SAMN05421799_11553 [Alicyclobacillus vulcanalis]|uniref:Uncharacterized protein n=1 Tax=Alicyclobacillus vulcanalis TaxID=252246 RepID=A0A1N7PP58_9BACL|nr:hypothetical protein SAMN05421799_11553 [Alicyclobacillus vulcanalis]